MFPGYVLINMVMNDDTWYVVRNTRGVTGFVGPGSKPVPLTEAEMRPLGIKEENVVVDFKEGDMVTIIGGVWKDTVGVIQSMNESKQIVTINVELFGRETPGRNKFRRSEENVSVSKGTITKKFKGGNLKWQKKVEGYIKLQIPAGKATPAPPVGPALGQHGVNIVEFTNSSTQRQLIRVI